MHVHVHVHVHDVYMYKYMYIHISHHETRLFFACPAKARASCGGGAQMRVLRFVVFTH